MIYSPSVGTIESKFRIANRNTVAEGETNYDLRMMTNFDKDTIENLSGNKNI